MDVLLLLRSVKAKGNEEKGVGDGGIMGKIKVAV